MKKELRDIKRLEEIFDVFVRKGLGYYLHKHGFTRVFSLRLKNEEKRHNGIPMPVILRESFEELGGSFLKLGQLLSLRPDLVPREISDEFKKLQDDVTPFSYEKAKHIVEEEFGKGLSKIFLKFEKKPIAAASIGQVHKARLLNKKNVVVKIQRPKIKEKIESDIDIFYMIARLLEKHVTMFNPVEIVREFERYTEKELDFLNESKNCAHIYKDFFKKKTCIPRVYPNLCTDKILVLEYIDGKRLDKVEGHKMLARKITDSIYTQVFINGFFHADPHPGNILVVKNDIAFIDFGIMGYLSNALRNKLADLFIAVVQKDIDSLSDSLINLGVVKDDIDKDELKEDIYDNFSEYYDLGLSRISISEVFGRVIDLSKKHKIRLPVNFVLLAKCAVTMESVVQGLDADYNPIESAKPFVEKLIKSKFSLDKLFCHAEKFRRFLFKIPDISDGVLKGIERGDKAITLIHNDISMMTKEIDKSSDRLALALIITALIVAGASMINIDQMMIFDLPLFSFVAFAFASFLIIILIVSILREKH